MKTMLSSYRRLLEREREQNLLHQFDTFMGQIGIQDGQASEDYFESFKQMLSIFESKGSAPEMMKEAVESEFFTKIMTAKTSFREREMRKLTHQLCDFIERSASNSVDDESFVQSLLANSLRSAADAIESSIREQRSEGESMNDLWFDALKVGLGISKI
jgi:hypothetical protein